MRNIKRILKENDLGDMGIGAMIVFISVDSDSEQVGDSSDENRFGDDSGSSDRYLCRKYQWSERKLKPHPHCPAPCSILGDK